MNKTEKEEIISQIEDLLKESLGVYLIDYHGVNVEDISKLRRNFRDDEVTYKIFKNTLFKRAYDKVGGYEKFDELMEGMTGIAFTGENFIAPAKIIKKYFDDKQKFVFKGAYIDSEFYNGDHLDALASMPTKEEVMSSIVGSIAMPATNLVGVVSAVMRDLVSIVDQISQKEAA